MFRPKPLVPVLLAAAALAAQAIAPRARAQELAVPAVDDSPSAQLQIEQAIDQARANPREAVRLLAATLDGDPSRLVRAGADPDLFVPVARRVHLLLASDAALRTAFRRELDADADERLARGELEYLVERRLDTRAGVRACVALAERSLVRGRVAAALGLVDRLAGHDLVDDATAAHLDHLRAECRRGLADACRDALTEGRFDESFASTRWGETWRVAFEGGALPASVDERPRLGDAPLPRSVPTVQGDRVFVSDGAAVRAFDRLGGRPLWSVPLDGAEGWGPLRLVGAGPSSVVGFASAVGTTRSGQARVVCIDPASGAVRIDARLDRMGAAADLEGVVAQGAPILIDGRVFTAARRTSPRLETVSWLLCVDPEGRGSLPWARVIATSGSVRLGTSRISESPVAADGVLFVATATGAVAAVDSRDGFVRWLRRFPVPVRDVNARTDAIDVVTPAVVGDAVLAVTPDRARIVRLARADGAVLAETPTSAEGGQALPVSLLGDAASGLVLAVGERVSCFRAEDPSTPLWSTPESERVRGRVRFASTADPGSPVVVVPGERDLSVVEARTGAERLRLPGAGGSNAAISGSQAIVAGTSWLAGWMPIAEAERIVRARMASSAGAGEAMALLGLARQVRAGPMAAEAAREAVRRARAEPDPVRAEVLELLIAIDALDLAEGADRAALDAAVDEAAAVAGEQVRGGFVRAQRLLRRGNARGAAEAAVRTAMGAPEGTLVPHADGLASPAAECRRIALQARAADPRAADAIDAAVSAALSSALPAERGRLQLLAARVGAGTPAGDRALASIIAAAADQAARRSAARVVRECVALGARVDDGVASRLGVPAWALGMPSPPARVEGSLARSVECGGRLPRAAPGADFMRGGFLAVDGESLVFRAAPSYAPVWRVPVGSAEFSVVATEPDILLCDDSRGGTGRVTCIGSDGVIRWSAAPEVTGPADAAGDDPDVDELRRLRGVGAAAFAGPGSVVVLAGDGGLTGFSRARGEQAWHRPPAGAIAAWAHDPLAIAVAEQVDDGSGAAIRVTVVDPDDGSAVLAWTCATATEVRWMRFVPGGLLAVGTDDGIEARRIAGDDGGGPCWLLDSVDARESARGWSAFATVAVLDRFDGLRSIDAWSGHWAGEAGERRMRSPVRDVLAGSGWMAAVHDDGIEFLDGRGVPIGRDAPAADRAYLAASASAGRLFVLDGSVEGSDPVPMRFGVLLHDLDASAGGLESAPPVLLRALGQRISSVKVIDGGLAVSNGSIIQVLEFSGSAPPADR